MCDLLSYYNFFLSGAIICPPFIFLLSLKVVFAFIFIHNLSAHFDTTCDTLKLESYCWGEITYFLQHTFDKRYVNVVYKSRNDKSLWKIKWFIIQRWIAYQKSLMEMLHIRLKQLLLHDDNMKIFFTDMVWIVSQVFHDMIFKSRKHIIRWKKRRLL